MRVEKTASFSQILSSLNFPDEEYCIGGKKIEDEQLPPPKKDTVELTARARRGKGRPVAVSSPSATEACGDAKSCMDTQGNRVKISQHGHNLASPDIVAWETGRNPGKTSA